MKAVILEHFKKDEKVWYQPLSGYEKEYNWPEDKSKIEAVLVEFKTKNLVVMVNVEIKLSLKDL